MHEYDIALKVLLQALNGSVLRQVTGVSVASWLNVELPQVQISRADLVGATVDGNLVHLELQSTNDPEMALRMAEYALRIYRQFGKFPKQIVLYVGEAPLHMRASLSEPGSSTPALQFQYTLIDIRDLDGAALLASAHIEDNLLAILTRLQDRAAMVRQILARIAILGEPARRAAFTQFLIISGLRRLVPVVKREAQKMPILNDILDHEVIGPAILQGRQEGRREVLLRQLETRFGPIPGWVEWRLANLSAAELDGVAIRIFDISRLEELFP